MSVGGGPAIVQDSLRFFYDPSDSRSYPGEPTTNVLDNPAATSPTNLPPGTYSPGWDDALHTDAVTMTSWSSGYNGGVGSPDTGSHAHWVLSQGPGSRNCAKYVDRNDLFGLGHRWLGISQTLGTPTSLGWGVDDEITISWDQRANVYKGLQAGLYHMRISPASYAFESNIANIPVTTINEWERVSFTSTITSEPRFQFECSSLYVWAQ